MIHEHHRTAADGRTLDAILANASAETRATNGDNGALADFLATLDGVLEREAILTIATTNDPKALDPAAQRSSRFDMVVTLPMPDEASRDGMCGRSVFPCLRCGLG